MVSVKKNFIYNTAYNLLSLIIPFITTPYISRMLGPEGVGAYSYTYSIAYYFVLFTMLGLTKYGNRTIAAIRDDQNAVNKTFSEIYVMQVITGIVSVSIYTICLVGVFEKYKFLLFIQLIYVLSAVFDVSWFFFGIEQFKSTVLRNVIIRVFNVAALFLFVKKADDVAIYCLIMAASTFITQISLWPVLLKRFVRFEKPTVQGVCSHIKMNLILFIPTIAVSLYKIMDKIMIGAYIDAVEVGYYENAEKIINIPMTLVTALGTVMLPRMTYFISTGNKKEEKRYIDITMSFMLWITCAMACGIIAIADVFVPFFLGEKFIESIMIVYILAPTMIFISWGNVISNQILIPRKKDRSYIIIVMSGAIVNLCVNMMLIPKIGADGAAYATLLTEAIVMIGYSVAAGKYFEWKRCVVRLGMYGALGVTMVLIVKNGIHFTDNIVWLIMGKIVAGGVYYLTISSVVAYLFDRNFFDFMLDQMKKCFCRVKK